MGQGCYGEYSDSDKATEPFRAAETVNDTRGCVRGACRGAGAWSERVVGPARPEPH